jgi:hypothetical protein
MAVLVSQDAITFDDETYYKAIDYSTGCCGPVNKGDELPIFVSINSNFERLVEEPMKTRIVLHVPKGARRITVQGPRKGEGSDSYQETIFTKMDDAPGEEPDPQEKTSSASSRQWNSAWSGHMDDAVKLVVSMDDNDGSFYLRHPLLDRLELRQSPLTQKQSAVALRFVGLSPVQILEVIEQVKISGRVAFDVANVEYDQGKDVVSSSMSKTSAALANVDKLIASMPKARLKDTLNTAYASLMPSTETEKVSSMVLGMTVDAALSLNFLTPQTLMKFVDMRPHLEEALSKVCALLVASRLGMSEVSESALSMCIEGLEPTLQGLRVMETSLQDM